MTTSLSQPVDRRAMRIATFLWGVERWVSVAEIARSLDIIESQVTRFVQNLVAEGYAAQRVGFPVKYTSTGRWHPDDSGLA